MHANEGDRAAKSYARLRVIRSDAYKNATPAEQQTMLDQEFEKVERARFEAGSSRKFLTLFSHAVTYFG